LGEEPLSTTPLMPTHARLMVVVDHNRAAAPIPAAVSAAIVVDMHHVWAAVAVTRTVMMHYDNRGGRVVARAGIDMARAAAGRKRGQKRGASEQGRPKAAGKQSRGYQHFILQGLLGKENRRAQRAEFGPARHFV